MTGGPSFRPAALPAAEPLRRTRHRSSEEMRRRAWRLLLMHLLVPGSVQLVEGRRAVGRVAIAVWAAVWLVVVAALVSWLVRPAVLIGALTSPRGLTALQILLVAVVAAWLALTVDTVRLLRLRRLRRPARAAVGAVAGVVLVAGGGSAAWGAFAVGVARDTISTVFPAAPAAAADRGRIDVLLLGMDRTRGRGALEPKSIAVLSTDVRSGASTLIGIPTGLRDVPFLQDSPLHRVYPDGYRDCIAGPCSLGDVYREGRAVGGVLYPDTDVTGTTPAVAATRDAVSGVLGRRVRYVLQLDTTALGELVDALGGVRLAAAGGSGAASDGRRVVSWLRGAEDRSGAAQMDRVLSLSTALRRQANPVNALLQLQRVAEASADAVRTDLPQETATELAVLAVNARSPTVRQLRLAPPVVPDLRSPDWTAVHRLVATATP